MNRSHHKAVNGGLDIPALGQVFPSAISAQLEGFLRNEDLWLTVAREEAKMRQKSVPAETAEQHVREIRRASA